MRLDKISARAEGGTVAFVVSQHGPEGVWNDSVLSLNRAISHHSSMRKAKEARAALVVDLREKRRLDSHDVSNC